MVVNCLPKVVTKSAFVDEIVLNTVNCLVVKNVFRKSMVIAMLVEMEYIAIL